MDAKHYEMSEKEILIESLKEQQEANKTLKTMITLFWWFYGVPFIIGFFVILALVTDK